MFCCYNVLLSFYINFQPKFCYKALAPPPNQLVYAEHKKFILRAHLYQARSLIGSDASGLSGKIFKSIFSIKKNNYIFLF